MSHKLRPQTNPSQISPQVQERGIHEKNYCPQQEWMRAYHLRQPFPLPGGHSPWTDTPTPRADTTPLYHTPSISLHPLYTHSLPPVDKHV